jgi:hypothetical protein
VKSHRFRMALVAVSFFAGSVIEGFAVTFEWKITSLYVKPQPAVSGPVTVGCAWTAKANSSWKFEKFNEDYGYQLVTFIEVYDVATNGNVDYFYWQVGTVYPPNGKSYPPGPVTEFEGVREHTVDMSAGPHKVNCGIDGTPSEDFVDDERSITFDVQVPKVSISDQPPGAGNVMAVTPQVPPTPPSRWKEPLRQAQAVLPPAGKPHRFRAGEKLFLVDGRSLTIQNARLVLLDGKGNVLRTFPPGVVVMVGSQAEVSIQRGLLNVPLGIAKRN